MHAAISADAHLRSIALSVARNNVGAARPLHEILAVEGIQQAEYDEIAKNPQYQHYVTAFEAELKGNGFSFAAKSRVLAEDLLPTAYHMARDMDIPAATRAKLIENLVEWGDLRPKNSANSASGPGFSITFNIPSIGNTPQNTITIAAENPQKPLEILEEVPVRAEKRTSIALLEPDDYEYAGDDVGIAP